MTLTRFFKIVENSELQEAHLPKRRLTKRK